MPKISLYFNKEKEANFNTGKELLRNFYLNCQTLELYPQINVRTTLYRIIKNSTTGKYYAKLSFECLNKDSSKGLKVWTTFYSIINSNT